MVHFTRNDKARIGDLMSIVERLAASHPEWGPDNDVGTDWERSGRDVLFGFRNCYHPCVLRVPDQRYPFRMWFFGWGAEDTNPGWPGCDAIFHARGRDLEHWEVYAGSDRWDVSMDPRLWVPVLCASEQQPWDQWHVGDPSVVLHEGRFFMAYSSTGFNLDGIPGGAEGDTDGDLGCVMGAVSQDGISWTRTARPLVMAEADLGRRVFPADQENPTTHAGFFHRPALLLEDGTWRLWFDFIQGTGDPLRPYRMGVGYAEATIDGFLEPGAFKMVRDPQTDPLGPPFPNPSVVRAGGLYHMFGDPHVRGGAGWASRKISHAVSVDGLDWVIVGYIEHDPDVATNQVPEAMVHLDEGGVEWLVVWYGCQIGGEPFDYRQDRIRFMRRRLDSLFLP